MDDTRVTFPAGAVTGTAHIQAVLPVDPLPADDTAEPDAPGSGSPDLVAVIVDRTPFHPVDHAWPDQPADRGTLAGIDLAGCVTGAVSPAGDLFLADRIPARRGEADWRWLVVHLVRAGAAAERRLAPGRQVELRVDPELRARYSRGHSACHLAALALNAVTAPLWDKDPGRTGSLGHPDLDSIAITMSRIDPDGSLDEYRLGKGVRKKGLRSAELLDRLPELQEGSNLLLARWTAAGGRSVVDTGGDDRLTARRTWSALLPEGPVAIPCGGTHVADLGELDPVTVTYEPTEAGFRVVTTVG